MDADLRELFDVAAGEPPCHVTFEAVRHRAIRRRMAQAGLAITAAVLAVAVSVTVSAGVFRTGTPAASSNGQQAGPPRYYVSEYFDAKTGRQVIAVRSTATGRVTAIVGAPAPGMKCGGGNVGIAAAGHQTFFMTCIKAPSTAARSAMQPNRFRPPGSLKADRTLIYRFRVTRSGRAAGYSLVKGGTLNGVWTAAIAASPDGRYVALEVLKPLPSGVLYTNTVPEGIVVIDTRTGTRALWHTGPRVAGTEQYAASASISFTAHGRTLVVVQARCRRGRYQYDCQHNGLIQVRAYSPAPGGGSLEAGQVLAPDYPGRISSAFISPDGTVLTALVTSCPRRGTCTLTVAEISVATGRVLRVLYRTHTGSRFKGIFMRFFSSDPSGRYLMLDAGSGKAAVNGWIKHGRLVPLAPANGRDVAYATW